MSFINKALKISESVLQTTKKPELKLWAKSA